MTRTVKEWIGKTDDTPVPSRVRLRRLEKFDGRCQCGCNRKIAAGEAWELDHTVALINGGQHRESNLRPLLREHHKLKSKADVAEKSRSYGSRARHAGIKKAKQPMAGWRLFDGTPVRNPKLRERNAS